MPHNVALRIRILELAIANGMVTAPIAKQAGFTFAKNNRVFHAMARYGYLRSLPASSRATGVHCYAITKAGHLWLDSERARQRGQ